MNINSFGLARPTKTWSWRKEAIIGLLGFGWKVQRLLSSQAYLFCISEKLEELSYGYKNSESNLRNLSYERRLLRCWCRNEVRSHDKILWRNEGREDRRNNQPSWIWLKNLKIVKQPNFLYFQIYRKTLLWVWKLR